MANSKNIIATIKACGTATYVMAENGYYHFEAFGRTLSLGAHKDGYIAQCKTLTIDIWAKADTPEHAVLSLLETLVRMPRQEAANLKAAILNAAIQLAEYENYTAITRAQIASELKITQSLISYYFGSMSLLRNEILCTAIQKGNLTIIAQGLINKDPLTTKIPKKMAERALASIVSAID